MPVPRVPQIARCLSPVCPKSPGACPQCAKKRFWSNASDALEAIARNPRRKLLPTNRHRTLWIPRPTTL